jgi:FMN-dependent oxidoreductase (nitrilotriacetate monooxygenase family)
MKRQMHLGLFILGTGSHVAGWRHPGAMTSFQDFDQVQEIARIAERGRFDLIFMGDNLYADPGAHPSYTVRLEPMTMLAALAAGTSRIGLGATVSTTYNDPWSVARVFASLDHISKGRAAWNAVTTASGQGADNFGTTHPDHASRYERAAEFVDVVKGLWDCWADDAIVADRASGTYIDAARMRPLDHEGTFFKVKGPINIGRSPQGHPVVPGRRLRAGQARGAHRRCGVLRGAGHGGVEGAIRPLKNGSRSAALPTMSRCCRASCRWSVDRKEAREKLALLQSYVTGSNACSSCSAGWAGT